MARKKNKYADEAGRIGELKYETERCKPAIANLQSTAIYAVSNSALHWCSPCKHDYGGHDQSKN